jgi:NADH-quinone oxidoreductase subunit E
MAACPVRNRLQVPEPVPTEETEETLEIDKIVDAYGPDRRHLIHILQATNQRFNFLPEPALRRMSERLRVPLAEVYGTASFYKAFSLEPRGEHLIRVCLGTACHVRGAPRVLDEFQRRLDIGAGATTKDRLFTLETVNCLGACALGPIVVVDDEYHGQMLPRKVPKLLDACLENQPHETAPC